MKVAVIVFPGSNCDHDMYHAFKKVIQVDTDFIWHKEHDLSGYDLIVLPGGFSYGDYLRSGAIARFSPVMKSVVQQAAKGKHILGICNGFQILTESGLLPGALMRNYNRKFLCKDIYLKTENRDTVFSRGISDNEVLTIPIAHGEGNYYCDPETLKSLQDHGQVVFRYADASGKITDSANPNGSVFNIAGIINKNGNVLGMMPHPERNVEALIGNSDGLKILNSIVNYFKRN